MNLIAKWNKNRKNKLLSIDEVKKMYPEYRYAVCNVATGNPVSLCENLETVRKTMENTWKYNGTMCFIVDLQYDEVLKVGDCDT